MAIRSLLECHAESLPVGRRAVPASKGSVGPIRWALATFAAATVEGTGGHVLAAGSLAAPVLVEGAFAVHGVCVQQALRTCRSGNGGSSSWSLSEESLSSPSDIAFPSFELTHSSRNSERLSAARRDAAAASGSDERARVNR